MRIAVDAMGGDNAPGVVVEGAISAAKENECEIVLVGDETSIKAILDKTQDVPSNISLQHASEVIGMHESPALSVRKKRDSSINVAVRLAKEKQVDAVVSAGNTGAFVCSATLQLRLLPGVERAGIGVMFPALKGRILLIDAGANVDPKPIHLFQYGMMGEAFYKYALGQEDVKIGLLNVGEEDAKGPDFLKDSYKLLEESDLNFSGNVEGGDIFRGDCDVIVCDGYVGNVALKVSEGLAQTMKDLLKAELSKGIFNKVGALLSKGAFKSLARKLDYDEYGGAPLLGVDGRCIICHGSSSAKAIKNAIKLAGYFVSNKVNQHIVEVIEKY